jgi:hypothetical protein
MFEPEVSAAVADPRGAVRGGDVVPASLTVEVFESVADAQQLADDWEALFFECKSRNPFVHPTWCLTWAEHFVKDGDLFVVAVRDRGELCCVAPLYRRRVGKGRARLARSLQLIGAVEHVVLTERSQILARGGHDRRAVRRVLEVIQADTAWDWVELALAADQGDGARGVCPDRKGPPSADELSCHRRLLAS